MYIVIFTAKLNKLDKKYYQMAKQLRDLAAYKYNCKDFNSINKDGNEVSTSCWQNLKDIQNWKNDKLHLKAQKLGQSKWYKSYNIEVTEVLRKYNYP